MPRKPLDNDFFTDWLNADSADAQAVRSLMTRLAEALSPVMEHLGPEAVENILEPVAAIARHDRQMALTLLTRYPAVIEALLPQGEQTVLAVLGLAGECIPYGVAVPFLEAAPAILAAGDFETLTRTAALACSISQINNRTAEILISQSPAILARVGFEGLREAALFAAACVRSNWHDSIRAIERCPNHIDKLLAAGMERTFLPTIYGVAVRIAQNDTDKALTLMETSPRIIKKLVALGGTALAASVFERAVSVTPFDAGIVIAFIDTAPALIERLGVEGAEPIWLCALTAAADRTEDAVILLRDAPKRVDSLLTHFHTRQIGAIYDRCRGLCRFGSALAVKFIAGIDKPAKTLDEPELFRLAAIAEKIAAVSLTAAGAFLDTAPALREQLGLEGLDQIAALAVDMAETSWEATARLILRSPELIGLIGMDGLRMVGSFCIPLARESVSEATRLLDKCPRIIGGLLEIGDFSLVEKVCHIAGGTVVYNARLASALLTRSPEIIGQAGLEGLQKMEGLAHDLGTVSWTAAVSLLEQSPPILKEAGLDGMARIAGLARCLARESGYGAVSFIEKSPELIRRLRSAGSETAVRQVFKKAQATASSDCKLATAILEAAPGLMAAIGLTGLERLMDLIAAKHSLRGVLAGRLIETAAAIMDKIGLEGLETLAELTAVLAGTDTAAAINLLEKSPSFIESIGDSDEYPLRAAAVYGFALQVARTSPAVALKLLAKTPELIQGFGFEGFCRIAAIIEGQAQTDEEKALSFLAADTVVMTDFMEGIPKGLEFKAVQPVLSTYLRALLGRRVELAEANRAYTDGLKIYLPGRIKDFQDDKDNFTLYKIEATHQEAHLEYGSFEFSLEGVLNCTERLVSRYGIVADEKENPAEQFVQLFPEPDLARDLFNILEDYRIEGLLKREYPVLGDAILRMNRHKFSKKRHTRKTANPKQRVVEMITQALAAQKTFDDDTDEAVPIVRTLQERSAVLVRRGADVHDAARLAAEAYILIDDAFKTPYRPAPSVSRHLDQDRVARNFGSFSRTARHIQERMSGRSPSQGARSQDAIEAPSGSGGETTPTNTLPVQESMQQRHRAGEQQTAFQSPTRGGRPQPGGSDPEGRQAGAMGGPMKYDSPEKLERLLRAAHREKGLTPREIQERFDLLRTGEIYHFLNGLEASLENKTELQAERGTSLYAEWGDDIGAYRDNWTRVREQPQTGTSLAFYRETLDKYAGLLRKIRREFQMLKPEGFTKLKRQYDGDDIDLDAVVEHLTDRKAGLSPPENNYRLTRKSKRDIACAFLIDMSRSTRGATIEREKEALIMMSEALHCVGDAFAVFGFSGDNRDNVDYYRIKDFDDPYDDKVKKRISAIADHFENRDGTAIRHTSRKLRKRPERTKLMILLSDGKPVDKAYSGLYAIEDTRMALKEARHDGVKTFCVTVDQDAAEYLPRMYSHSSWTVIDDVVKLPEKITRIYRMLTA